MTRVGIFTDNDFEKVNGVTTALRAVLEHAPADVQPRIFTCTSTQVDEPHYLALRARGVGIPFYSEMKMYAPPVGRLLDAARAAELDVIHLTTPGPVGLAAMWVASRLHLPLVGSFHTHLSEYVTRLSGSQQMGQLMQVYLRWAYGQCREVLAPSAATRDMLIASGMDARRLSIWNRGVSTTRFDPNRRCEALRTSWGVSDERPAVLYVGRVSREKGLSDFVGLRRYLDARRVPCRFGFVGDGPVRRELQLELPDAVFMGTQTPEQVAVAMASADLFVFPSRTDTAGNVVLEAQASGLPVIVTDEGGPKENMTPDVTGVVCASSREMHRVIAELCARGPRRQRMSAAARAYALTRNWTTALDPLFRSYREAAASSVTHRAQSPASGVAPA